MSGLTRRATLARRPAARAAASEMRSISRSDSALKARRPASTPARISSSVLPTPEKTIRSAGNPLSRQARSSPPETTSAPAPSCGEPLEDREARIGLGRVADEVRESGERGVEAPEGLFDLRPAVDVERRAVLAREIRERHAVAAQLAFTPLESRRACRGHLRGRYTIPKRAHRAGWSADEAKASARRTDHRRAAASELLCPGRAERRSRSRR